MSGKGHISLRGVSVHNLKAVDLDIPRGKLVVFCGLSGSGKTSLAIDTLYAEGQRRYIESFSAYTRQFLDRLEKPQADRIDGLPPAIAVTGGHPLAGHGSRSARATVGTATEVADYLRLLFAKIGKIICRKCGRDVRRDSPQSAAAVLAVLPEGRRFMLAFAVAGEAKYNRPSPPAPLPEGEGRHEAPSPLPSPDHAAHQLPSPLPSPGGRGGLDAATVAALREEGFVRAIVGERMVSVDELSTRYSVLSTAVGGPALAEGRSAGAAAEPSGELRPANSYVVVDRLSVSGATEQRIRDSLETAFARGNGKCFAFVEEGEAKDNRPSPPAPRPEEEGRLVMIDGRIWRRLTFTATLACGDCGIEYLPPEPRLFSFNSPLGACPKCEGFGNIVGVDKMLVVPDPSKSIREGAIAPWNTPAYSHELEELLALAPDYGLPVDVPYSQLTAAQRKLIMHGVRERNFGGLDGFFAWLQRRKYKMPIRVFLGRWRSYRPCPACGGTRLRPEALDARIGGRNIGEICAMQVREAAEFFRALSPPLPPGEGRREGGSHNDYESKSVANVNIPHPLPLSQRERGALLSPYERRVGRTMLEQVRSRLDYLESVGLGYLTLDRVMRTLSGGEARRVALTSALGSSLVHTLYVLDEPSIGLHAGDVDRLVRAILSLRDRGNTVVVVEHEEALIRAADQVVEIGPGAGERGGRIVFQGASAEMEASRESLTGDYLAGRRGKGDRSNLPRSGPEGLPDKLDLSPFPPRREPNRGWIRLVGARGNNLKNITAEFPLGLLCLVTGVSGSGKSTLVEDTLYPALCRRIRKDAPQPLDYDDVFGDGQIDDCILVDQSPIGRSPRSNPATYLKVFDEIRNVFAATVEARTRGFDAGHFSFNLDAGRCATCQGDGCIRIDMQFLPDVYVKCSQCGGTRYRDEILAVTYRGRNIAEVLEMTVREAFAFFRGKSKLQARLKRLIDVGLDYIRLGQPANTLSGGEAQRLKLAAYMSKAKRNRCLFILDEPTTGLHYSDVVQLLDCFDALLAVGHSLVVVEHNLQMMKAADYMIDLGPGAADEGGRVVAKGTPEEVALNAESVTGRFLLPFLLPGLAGARQGP